MKKTILLACALTSSLLSFGQDTITCSITVEDTVKYINSLSSGIQGTGINMSNGTGGTAGYTGYAQLFEAPDSITLKGFCFYSLIEGALPDTVDAGLFLPDGTGGAPGTLVENVRVGVPDFNSYTGPMNSASIKRCAVFSSPIEIEGDYFLSVRNLSDANIYMAINYDGDAAVTPTEFTYYHEDAGTYTGWYDLDAFGTGWGFNPVIEPLVEYTFSGTTIASDSILCIGDTLTLEMTIEEGDSVLLNKHYNPNYSTYNGLSGTTVINYGDGTTNTVDTFHVYNAGGSYAIDRNFTITTPIWSQSSVAISCPGNVRVIDASVDLGVDTSVCAGTVLTFDAGLGYDSYLWNDLSTMSNLSIDTDTMMMGMYSYSVEVTKEFCSASDTVSLTVGQLSVELGGDTTLCLNQDLTLTAGTFDTYNWNTGQTTETITVGPFSAAGVQTIVLDVTQGTCEGSDTLVLTVDNCLGVDEVPQSAVLVYPNPSNGLFTIDLSEFSAVEGKIRVIDQSGRVVLNKNITNLKEEISLIDIAKGSYLVEINAGGEQIMKKIQIIK